VFFYTLAHLGKKNSLEFFKKSHSNFIGIVDKDDYSVVYSQQNGGYGGVKGRIL
jgi:hypothetical protein